MNYKSFEDNFSSIQFLSLFRIYEMIFLIIY